MSYTVYLAGGLNSDWRVQLADRWLSRNVACYDPMTESRQDAIYEFTNDDLAALRDSDLLFGHCTYHHYTGMALEFGFAHGLGIPIVYVCTQSRIDSMMVAVSKAAFTDLAAAVEYTEKRLLPEACFEGVR